MGAKTEKDDKPTIAAVLKAAIEAGPLSKDLLKLPVGSTVKITPEWAFLRWLLSRLPPKVGPSIHVIQSNKETGPRQVKIEDRSSGLAAEYDLDADGRIVGRTFTDHRGDVSVGALSEFLKGMPTAFKQPQRGGRPSKYDLVLEDAISLCADWHETRTDYVEHPEEGEPITHKEFEQSRDLPEGALERAQRILRQHKRRSDKSP
jgi:hypothetical protein